jgi:hypothetical protein
MSLVIPFRRGGPRHGACVALNGGFQAAVLATLRLGDKLPAR